MLGRRLMCYPARLKHVACKPLPCLSPQMLVAPLSQQRLAHAAAALEVAALPLTSLLPGNEHTASALLAGQADPERVCVAAVSFGELLLGLLPVAVQAQWWRPPVEPSTQHGRPRRQGWQCSNQLLQRWLHVTPHDGGWVLRAWVCCAALWLGCRLAAGLV